MSFQIAAWPAPALLSSQGTRQVAVCTANATAWRWSGPSWATAQSVKLTSGALLAKQTEQRGSRLQCKPPSLSPLQTDITSWRRKAALSAARSCSLSFKMLIQTQRSARQTRIKNHAAGFFRCREGFETGEGNKQARRESCYCSGKTKFLLL